ncbi:amidohydrolase family protein [Nocardia sp. NPDC056000]|uniref:amidohydrolase family protein n=1 Tax=Nocardia sp. NPDC056000 TaxID=3345674 RepID=UPI0035E3B04F
MGSAHFVIRGARVFDGREVLDRADVLVEDGRIVAVGTVAAPVGAEVVDGTGRTLIPGLIDAHAHAKPPALAQAIVFGVTTELDMGSDPKWMLGEREKAAARDDVADVRSSSFGTTVPGGHPSMLIGSFFEEQFPTVSTIDDIPGFVTDRLAEGADYIKLLIDDGSAMGHASPTLNPAMVAAIVGEAHRHGKMALAHVTTLEGARQAVDAGVDGLVHLFMDTEPTAEIIEHIRQAGIFVIPTLSTLGSLAGETTGEALAHDPRVNSLVPDAWHENLCACWKLGGESKLEYSLAAARMLHEAGVPVLMGTDAASLGVFGTAHGVSAHGELALLVRAGLTPVEALRAATSLPAKHFGLTDRGAIAPGLQADLVLIDGDPTTDISTSLSIDTVWRRGSRLDREHYRAQLATSAAKE